MSKSLSLCVALLCIASAAGQPVSCKDDAQCTEGYFCEADAHICRECLRCQDLKRKPPATPAADSCVKSVAECGDCYEGLEVDRRHGDVGGECVAAMSAAGAAEPAGASRTWLYIIVALVAVAFVVVVVIVLLLRRDIFKPPGSGRNSVTATITATAPEAPPPYNAVPTDPAGPYYTANGHGHAANGHGHMANGHASNGHSANGHFGPYEEDHPFIVKPAPHGGHAREAAGSQAARVYEKPFYLRENQPPSPASPASDTEEDTSFFQDEATTESVWTPHHTANGDADTTTVAEAGGTSSVVDAGGATSLSAQLAAARRTDLVQPAPKKMRLHQDTNNNRNRESNSTSDSTEVVPRSPSPHAHAHGSHAGHAGQPPYITQIINVVQYNANK